MTDLATWLLQQIAEDEAVAREASPRPWYDDLLVGRGEDYSAGVFNGQRRICIASPADAAHIARWDPARVLAECEAKRLRVVWAQANWRPGDNVADGLLRWEALPYADRPGYRQEWAP